MTDQKQEKPKQPNWIVKAGGDAILAGGVTGSGSLLASLVFGWPIEIVPEMALTGFTISLYTSWKHSKEKDKPKSKSKPRGRSIDFNHGKGTTKIYPDDTLEFSIEQGGYVLRESYAQGVWRKVAHKGSRPLVRPVESVDKPRELDEFMFYSQGLQLRETHVKLFLARAWKWHQFGKGLSARQYVRNFSQMPAWFQELSPMWFYAMLELLRCAGDHCHFYLVVEYGNGWRSLINEPRLTLRILRWYEIERRKAR